VEAGGGGRVPRHRSKEIRRSLDVSSFSRRGDVYTEQCTCRTRHHPRRLGRICFRYPQPFPPTSGGKSADTEGCVSGVDSSSRSPVAVDHFVGIGSKSPLPRRQATSDNSCVHACKFMIGQLQSHLDTSLLRLSRRTTPSSSHNGRAGG
jgi:hypothetical protein